MKIGINRHNYKQFVSLHYKQTVSIMSLLHNLIDGAYKKPFNTQLLKATHILEQCSSRIELQRKKISQQLIVKPDNEYNDFLLDLRTDKRVKEAKYNIEKAANGMGYYRNMDSFVSLTLKGLRAQHVIDEELYNIQIPSIRLTDYPLSKFDHISELRGTIKYLILEDYNKYPQRRDIHMTFDLFIKRRRKVLLRKAETLIKVLAESDIPLGARALGVKALIILSNEIEAPRLYALKEKAIYAELD